MCSSDLRSRPPAWANSRKRVGERRTRATRAAARRGSGAHLVKVALGRAALGQIGSAVHRFGVLTGHRTASGQRAVLGAWRRISGSRETPVAVCQILYSASDAAGP